MKAKKHPNKVNYKEVFQNVQMLIADGKLIRAYQHLERINKILAKESDLPETEHTMLLEDATKIRVNLMHKMLNTVCESKTSN